MTKPPAVQDAVFANDKAKLAEFGRKGAAARARNARRKKAEEDLIEEAFSGLRVERDALDELIRAQEANEIEDEGGIPLSTYD